MSKDELIKLLIRERQMSFARHNNMTLNDELFEVFKRNTAIIGHYLRMKKKKHLFISPTLFKKTINLN